MKYEVSVWGSRESGYSVEVVNLETGEVVEHAEAKTEALAIAKASAASILYGAGGIKVYT